MNGVTKQMVWCGSHLCDRAVLEDKDIARLYKHWRSLADMQLMFDRSDMPGPRFHSTELKVAQDWLDAAVLLWFEGRPANLPPTEDYKAPEPPGRYTAIVDPSGNTEVIVFDDYERPAVEPEPIDTSGLMVGVIWFAFFALIGAVAGWAVYAGVISLRGFRDASLPL
jgi:hypothetical protein